MNERTVVILKPDCMKKNQYGDVLIRFARVGLEMIACKMMRLDEAILREHYDFLVDKPFFPDILRFMTSTPVLITIFRGENAISRVREMLGPTDSTLAAKGTIRGDFGTDKSRNVAHASDHPDTAEKEIQRFFKIKEIFD
jgi:nucleoside-diphosphate kinase